MAKKLKVPTEQLATGPKPDVAPAPAAEQINITIQQEDVVRVLQRKLQVAEQLASQFEAAFYAISRELAALRGKMDEKKVGVKNAKP